MRARARFGSPSAGSGSRDRVGPNAAGLPRRGGPPAVVFESYPSEESGDMGCPAAAGAYPGQVRAAGPSRPVERRAGGWDQNNKRKACHSENVSRFLTACVSISNISKARQTLHSTAFAPILVHVYAHRNVPLRFSAATLHVLGPVDNIAAFSVVRVGPDGRPMRPSRKPRVA